MKKDAATVCIVPDDTESARILATTLGVIGGPVRIVADRNRADIVIVDGDSPEGERFLAAAGPGNSRRKVLAIGVRQDMAGADMTLSKPVSAAHLRDALIDLARAVRRTARMRSWRDSLGAAETGAPASGPAAPGGTPPEPPAPPPASELSNANAKEKPASDSVAPPASSPSDAGEPAKPAPEPKKASAGLILNANGRVTAADASLYPLWEREGGGRYDAENVLHGVIVRAVNQARATGFSMRLDLVPEPLYLLPGRRQIRTRLTFPQLMGLALQPVDQLRRLFPGIVLEPVPCPRPPDDIETAPWYGFEDFIWQTVIYACRGNLNGRIPPDLPFRLRFWPNVTRLTLPPNGVRICALLEKRPASANEIPELLSVPRFEAYAMISALHAIGALEKAKRAAKTVEAAPPPQSETDRGVFAVIGKMLKRLRGES